jgi:large subunit ribosomal protein L33
MAKSKREIIKLVSSAGTGYFYTTKKKRAGSAGKLERKKYDPVARKHVPFKEKPIK